MPARSDDVVNLCGRSDDVEADDARLQSVLAAFSVMRAQGQVPEVLSPSTAEPPAPLAAATRPGSSSSTSSKGVTGGRRGHEADGEWAASAPEGSKKQAGRRMCEDCGDVTAAFGYETARKRRWCKKCASGHGLGVVNLSKSVNPHRLVGPSGAPATAANLPPGPKVGGSHSLGP